MTSFLTLAQMSTDHGWLTQKLLSTFTSDAEWVLWLLAVLSVLSIAVMLERAIYFATHKLDNTDDVMLRLSKGDLSGIKASVVGKRGMEAAILREGIEWADKGSGAVEEVINATIARERPRYERFLSFLGTLGANTPFIGLFGTVLGIIKAFHDLGVTGSKGSEVQQTVMAGISAALVATAVGLAVAIPAVVGYNLLTRQLKGVTSRSAALGHALIGHIKGLEK